MWAPALGASRPRAPAVSVRPRVEWWRGGGSRSNAPAHGCRARDPRVSCGWCACCELGGSGCSGRAGPSTSRLRPESGHTSRNRAMGAAHYMPSRALLSRTTSRHSLGCRPSRPFHTAHPGTLRREERHEASYSGRLPVRVSSRRPQSAVRRSLRRSARAKSPREPDHVRAAGGSRLRSPLRDATASESTSRTAPATTLDRWPDVSCTVHTPLARRGARREAPCDRQHSRPRSPGPAGIDLQ
jgi:hypothetical protein